MFALFSVMGSASLLVSFWVMREDLKQGRRLGYWSIQYRLKNPTWRTIATYVLMFFSSACYTLAFIELQKLL